MRKSDALWLFGSSARGDVDWASDIDLLLVSDRRDAGIPVSLFKMLKPSVTHYSWADFEHMASYGSLFLLHVRMDGCPIFEGSQVSGRAEKMLGSMTGYKYANRDILSFRRAIDDIGNSCRNNDIEFFELSNLAIVVRHIAILGCYLIGKPDFSRYTAVKVCCASLCPEVMLPKTFPRLYDYRLFADGRGKKPDGVEAAQLWQWLKDAEALLRAVEDASNGYRNPMH